MLKQLRNDQDTRTLCGVVFDTYLVPSQLNALVAARAQTQTTMQCTRRPRSRPATTVHLGVGGRGPRTHHRRDEAGRGTGAALGSHGRAEQAVDRGEVRGDQTLPNRQDFSATAVQGLSRRRNAASASCGGETAENVALRRKARTGSSDGAGTGTSRLVGCHEVMCEGSARDRMLETSKFLGRTGRTSVRRHGK